MTKTITMNFESIDWLFTYTDYLNRAFRSNVPDDIVVLTNQHEFNWIFENNKLTFYSIIRRIIIAFKNVLCN